MPFLSKLAPGHSTATLASATAFKKLRDDSAIVGPIPSDVHTRREWVAAAQFAVNSLPFLLSDVQQLLPNERKTLAAMYGINDNNRSVATVCAEIVVKINASYGSAPSKGVLTYIRRYCKLPLCILAAGAVPKSTPPFWRLVIDCRPINPNKKTYKAWVKFITKATNFPGGGSPANVEDAPDLDKFKDRAPKGAGP